MTTCALLAWLLVQVAPVAEEVGEIGEPALTNWFIIYIVVMVTAAMMGILLLIVILSMKLSRISKQLDEMSDSAATFIRIGLDHFKDRTGRRSGPRP